MLNKTWSDNEGGLMPEVQLYHNCYLKVKDDESIIGIVYLEGKCGLSGQYGIFPEIIQEGNLEFFFSKLHNSIHLSSTIMSQNI